MYYDPDGHMPQCVKWTIGGTLIAASIVLTIATGGAAAGPIAAAVHTVATGAMIGSIASAAVGTVAGGITFDGGKFGWDWDNAATGFMLGSITGTISGAIGGGLDLLGIEAESWLARGIMAGVDSVLGLGSYFAQNAINHTMDNISFMGAAISFAGGLFSLSTPTDKVFDAIWGATMGAEIAWLYDTIRVGIKNRR